MQAYYFPHDYNSKGDQKILTLRDRFGNEGYALFWYCLESMAEERDGYLHGSAIGGLSVSYSTTKEKLTEFIDFCIKIGLFHKTDDNRVYSERMMKYKAFRHERSISGKKGADVRWLSHSSATQQPMLIKGKERKGKEIKENISVSTPKLFKPPTVDEVRQYVSEHSLTIDPDRFVNHYTANGWYRGKTKIRDWKACVRTWQTNDRKAADPDANVT